MKPIDLQVNILKSLDMVSEKARESVLNSQIQNLEDESKKDRQSRDFHVPDNKESESLKNKLPERLPKRGKSQEKESKEEKEREKRESKKSRREDGEFTEDMGKKEMDKDVKLGKNLDLQG